jgi:hypothetical protein
MGDDLVEQAREYLRARLFSTNSDLSQGIGPGLLSNESTPQSRKDAYRYGVATIMPLQAKDDPSTVLR